MSVSCADRLRDLHAQFSKVPWYPYSSVGQIVDALPEIAAVIEAAKEADRWNPQLDVGLAHLHPQHRKAILAYREAEAALARRLETQP